MNLDNEKELFKRAYLNLRTADSIPFPDAVFDEYVRLRDSEGYKLVPVEPSQEMLIAADSCEIDGKVTAHNIYKAMINSCDNN